MILNNFFSPSCVSETPVKPPQPQSTGEVNIMVIPSDLSDYSNSLQNYCLSKFLISLFHFSCLYFPPFLPPPFFLLRVGRGRGKEQVSCSSKINFFLSNRHGKRGLWCECTLKGLLRKANNNNMQMRLPATGRLNQTLSDEFSIFPNVACVSLPFGSPHLLQMWLNLLRLG